MTIEVIDQKSEVINCMRAISQVGPDHVTYTARAIQTAES